MAFGLQGAARGKTARQRRKAIGWSLPLPCWPRRARVRHPWACLCLFLCLPPATATATGSPVYCHCQCQLGLPSGSGSHSWLSVLRHAVRGPITIRALYGTAQAHVNRTIRQRESGRSICRASTYSTHSAIDPYMKRLEDISMLLYTVFVGVRLVTTLYSTPLVATLHSTPSLF